MGKNIGIVTFWFERGAAYVSKQYIKLLEGSYNIHIYARGGDISGYTPLKDRWEGENVTWDKGMVDYRPTTVNLRQFKKWLIKNNIQLVFFNEQRNWESVVLCRELGITIGSYIDYYTEETIPFFRLYDFLVCNTKRHFSVFSWHDGVNYVPWGTDVALFKPSKNFPNPSSDKIVFFHSAGMNPKRKGTDLLIKAFNKISSKKCKLLIHTQLLLEDSFPNLRSIIGKLQAQERLEIVQKTIPAPGLYKYADIYVYPSRLDGIGLTICEAMSSGLPVIVSDNPPMNEFVQESSNKIKIERFFTRKDGYYWPSCECSIEDLSNKMLLKLESEEALSEEKIATREKAVSQYSWYNNKQLLLDIFNEHINNGVPKELDFELLNRVKEFEEKRIHILAKTLRHIPFSRQLEILLRRAKIL